MQIRARFENWLAQQATAGRTFTDDQRRWHEMMRDHIAASIEIDIDDFDLSPFAERGGLGKASQVFGAKLGDVVKELNEVLAA